jgi:hypothetical protein
MEGLVTTTEFGQISLKKFKPNDQIKVLIIANKSGEECFISISSLAVWRKKCKNGWGRVRPRRRAGERGLGSLAGVLRIGNTFDQSSKTAIVEMGNGTAVT